MLGCLERTLGMWRLWDLVRGKPLIAVVAVENRRPSMEARRWSETTRWRCETTRRWSETTCRRCELGRVARGGPNWPPLSSVHVPSPRPLHAVRPPSKPPQRGRQSPLPPLAIGSASTTSPGSSVASPAPSVSLGTVGSLTLDRGLNHTPCSSCCNEPSGIGVLASLPAQLKNTRLGPVSFEKETFPAIEVTSSMADSCRRNSCKIKSATTGKLGIDGALYR